MFGGGIHSTLDRSDPRVWSNITIETKEDNRLAKVNGPLRADRVIHVKLTWSNHNIKKNKDTKNKDNYKGI